AAEEDPAHRNHRTLREPMTDPADMIVSPLREMHAENLVEHERTRALVMTLDIEAIGDQALENKARELEGQT
ncbi:MAG TPA: hypothetical protein VII39_04910, partial [Bradyrhizobium sp.]